MIIVLLICIMKLNDELSNSEACLVLSSTSESPLGGTPQEKAVSETASHDQFVRVSFRIVSGERVGRVQMQLMLSATESTDPRPTH